MAAGVRPKKIGKVNLFKIDWTGKDKKEICFLSSAIPLNIQSA